MGKNSTLEINTKYFKYIMCEMAVVLAFKAVEQKTGVSFYKTYVPLFVVKMLTLLLTIHLNVNFIVLNKYPFLY